MRDKCQKYGMNSSKMERILNNTEMYNLKMDIILKNTRMNNLKVKIIIENSGMNHLHVFFSILAGRSYPRQIIETIISSDVAMRSF